MAPDPLDSIFSGLCVNASFDFKKLKATIPPLRENHSQWKESRH